MISLIVPSPKIRTKIPLKKFIATATVSGPIQNPLIAPMRLNQNVMKLCRISGGVVAVQLFHRNTQ